MRVTGSKAHRVWKCAVSAVLPQLETDDSKYEPARDKGKGIHAFLETVKAGRPEALAAAPRELVPLLEALDLDDLPVDLACEVAFAWNWRAHTARELGRSPDLPRRVDGGVDYDKLGVDWSCEVPGTYDVVGVVELQDLRSGNNENRIKRGYVGDYKSGHVKYPAPDLFAQTLLGALCVRAVYGCDDVVVELIHIHDNGGHHKARRTLNEWDLDVFARELTSVMLAIEAEHDNISGPGDAWAELTPREGPHCDYCPAFKACPAKVGLVRSIPEKLLELGIRPGTLPDEDGVERNALVLTPGMLTVRNAAQAWMTLELIADVVNRAKDEVIGIAAFEEIPLPDGRVIGRVVNEKRSLDGRVAAEVLEARYGRATRDEFVEPHVTMAALRQAAVKNKMADEKIETKNKTGCYDKLLAAVEAKGGVQVATTDAIKPHIPKKKLLPSG